MDRQYIIDANILITASRQLYPFDIMPGFWTQLLEKGESKLILLDKVKEEIYQGSDDLADWLQQHEDEFVQKDMYDDLVVASYGQVIQSVMDDDTYMEVAKADFASVADSWICAHALSKGYVIVTQETFEPNCKKRVKIPNVCKGFDIEYINLIQFLREIGMRIR